jgi:hypothetical protein
MGMPAAEFTLFDEHGNIGFGTPAYILALLHGKLDYLQVLFLKGGADVYAWATGLVACSQPLAKLWPPKTGSVDRTRAAACLLVYGARVDGIDDRTTVIPLLRACRDGDLSKA